MDKINLRDLLAGSSDSLFLVRANVRISHYMSDDDERSEVTHIVLAEDEKHADQKVMDHYEAKTSEYSTYYYCYIGDTTEIIL